MFKVDAAALHKLQGPDDLPAWSSSVASALQSQGLWLHVSGQRPKPARSSGADGVTLAEVTAWEDADQRAQGILRMSLGLLVAERYDLTRVGAEHPTSHLLYEAIRKAHTVIDAGTKAAARRNFEAASPLVDEQLSSFVERLFALYDRYLVASGEYAASSAADRLAAVVDRLDVALIELKVCGKLAPDVELAWESAKGETTREKVHSRITGREQVIQAVTNAVHDDALGSATAKALVVKLQASGAVLATHAKGGGASSKSKGGSGGSGSSSGAGNGGGGGDDDASCWYCEDINKASPTFKPHVAIRRRFGVRKIECPLLARHQRDGTLKDGWAVRVAGLKVLATVAESIAGEAAPTPAKVEGALLASLPDDVDVLEHAFIAALPGALYLREETLLAACALAAWILDSGCSTHCSGSRDHFRSLVPLPKPIPLAIAGSDKERRPLHMAATHVGDVVFMAELGDGRRARLTFRNVLYVPDLPYSLISSGKIEDAGYRFESERGVTQCFRRDDAGALSLAFVAERARGGLPTLVGRTEAATAPIAATAHVKGRSLHDWHAAYGHAGYSAVEEATRRVTGMVLTDRVRRDPCEPCMEGKQKRGSFPSSIDSETPPATEFLERIWADLVVFEAQSLGGSRYAAIIHDQRTHGRFSILLRQKNEFCATWDAWLRTKETSHKVRCRFFRSDGGGEFKSKAMDGLLAARGIKAETSPPKTAPQNGQIERDVQTSVNDVVTVIRAAGLSKGFWAEALSYSDYTRLRTPNAALGGKTPFELIYGHPPDVAHLQPFGAYCWVNVLRGPPEAGPEVKQVPTDGLRGGQGLPALGRPKVLHQAVGRRAFRPQ
jgi:hypothetical protein